MSWTGRSRGLLRECRLESCPCEADPVHEVPMPSRCAGRFQAKGPEVKPRAAPSAGGFQHLGLCALGARECENFSDLLIFLSCALTSRD